jgi:hypothetical protein
MAHCIRHYEEPMEGVCRSCDRPYCGRCLVFAFGPDKPPYCVGCALTASGVRNKGKVVVSKPAAPSGADRKLEKAQRRAERKAAKVEAKAERKALKSLPPLVEPEPPRPSTVPAPDNLSMPTARYGPPAMEQQVS